MSQQNAAEKPLASIEALQQRRGSDESAIRHIISQHAPTNISENSSSSSSSSASLPTASSVLPLENTSEDAAVASVLQEDELEKAEREEELALEREEEVAIARAQQRMQEAQARIALLRAQREARSAKKQSSKKAESGSEKEIKDPHLATFSSPVMSNNSNNSAPPLSAVDIDKMSQDKIHSLSHIPAKNNHEKSSTASTEENVTVEKKKNISSVAVKENDEHKYSESNDHRQEEPSKRQFHISHSDRRKRKEEMVYSGSEFSSTEDTEDSSDEDADA
jgi:hypothetical protein